MFHKSHLDQHHHASTALSGGLGDDAAQQTVAPSVPAPVPASGDLLKKVLLIGGIAAIVFLVLKHLAKKK